MAADLHHLLNRIQTEGVDKAEAEATRIRGAAESERERILAAARAEAAALIEKARAESAIFEQRARQAIEQAGRDTVLWVEEAVNRALAAVIGAGVDAALDANTLKDMLVAIVQSYTERTRESAAAAAPRLEALLPPAQQSQVAALFLGALAESLRKGVELRGDERVLSGFRVALADSGVVHDFTGEAIAEAMSQFLRPEVARLLRQATQPGART